MNITRRDLLKVSAPLPVVGGAALALSAKPVPPLRLRYFFQCNAYFHKFYSRYPEASERLHELRRRPMFAQTRPPSPAVGAYKWAIGQNGSLTYLGCDTKCPFSRTKLRYIVRTAGVIHLFYSPEPLPRLPMHSCIIDAIGVLHTPSYVANTPPNGTIHIWNAFMQGDECFAEPSPPPIYNPDLAKNYWDQLSTRTP